MSKNINLFNIIVFSCLVGIIVWKLISAIALVFFDYDLGWLLELFFSTLFTGLVINPLVGKMMDFSKSFNTNLVWIIMQTLGIVYLINTLGPGIHKIEHKTK